MELPIAQHREELLALVRAHPVVIVTGEPGTGKTTQVPQYLLDCRELAKLLGCRSLKVVVTQPRRVAAVAMARRVASERHVKLGHEVSARQVGYAIRFEDRSNSRTQIKYVTDGVLIRECLQDSDLTKYSIVMLDEVHERTLDTDVLLALAKQAVKRRSENMRLVVTSATLNIEQFSQYFDNCPVLQVSTRAFNIEVLHCTSKADRRVENSVTAAIRIHLHEGPGDVLVFLTGSEECERACKLCLEKLNQLLERGKPVPAMIIMPLYGAMPSEEQAKVFEPAPPDCRKVIFSTNIAETSLTIQGICFVIDCGYVKQKMYNPKTGLDALMVVPISRQQAKQRAGRAGRVADGKCYRLYSDTFCEQQMEEAAKPEILRVNLSSTLLTLKAMGIHDVNSFEFIDPPDYESCVSVSVTQALKLLYYLGAVYEDGRITPLGKEMSRLPVEPCFARCLVASVPLNCTSDMLTVNAI